MLIIEHFLSQDLSGVIYEMLELFRRHGYGKWKLRQCLE